MIKEAIEKIVGKGDLTYDEAYAVMKEIMTGQTTPTQNAAFLAALSTKSTKAETIDEISGCAQAMREQATPVPHPGMEVLEIVGTGGDKSSTFNISTTSAMVIAAAGIKVAKHGNRAASSKSGTADCQEALGVNIQQDPEKAYKMLQDVGLCFLFALLFIGESGGSRACSCRDFRLVSGEVHGRTRRELSKSLISGGYCILLHTHLLQSVYGAVEIGVKVGNIIFLALELLHPSAVGVETVLILYARHTSRTLIHCAGAVEFLRVRSNGIVDVFLFELEVNELALILGDFLLRSLSTRGENDIRGECAIFLRSFACKYCLLCEIAEHLRVDFLQLFNRCNTLFLRFCMVLSG